MDSEAVKMMDQGWQGFHTQKQRWMRMRATRAKEQENSRTSAIYLFHSPGSRRRAGSVENTFEPVRGC